MDASILNAAEALLGPAVKVERHRDWAVFWCPFHGDRQRAGQGGHPNFGVHLVEGYWKCLRCGASGASLDSLGRALGRNWRPPRPDALPACPAREPTQVGSLDAALEDARARLQRSPALAYLAGRGVSAYTALVYGLGYGSRAPRVPADVTRAARQSLLVGRDGDWLWAGSVVYADPPTRPTVINARYIPQEQLPPGDRRFLPPDRHRTWGSRIQPLGAWRLRPSTRRIIVVEGLFDMLVAAGKIHSLGLDESVSAVYTNGASPSHRMLAWFSQHGEYRYTLVRDPDTAGEEWGERVSAAIRQATPAVRICTTPGSLDPDEAILEGWWPEDL